jgi:hypothetical protein
MYKPSTYLIVAYLFLPIYPCTRLISYRIGYQGEPNINSVKVHPQLSNNRHPVDGALVGAEAFTTKCSSLFCEGKVSLGNVPSKYTKS